MIERVRVLIEGTAWPEAVVASRVGVDPSTVNVWKVRRKWSRPADASLSTGKVGLARAGFTRRCREVLRRAGVVAAREVMRLEEAGQPADLARARALVAALADAGRRRRRPAAGAGP